MKDLTPQFDRVRRIMAGDRIHEVYPGFNTILHDAYHRDLVDIAFAAITNFDRERRSDNPDIDRGTFHQ